MCCRGQEPARGQWAPPLGFLECGETLEEGAARETFEETAVRVAPDELQLYAVINMQSIDQIAISFRVELAEFPAVHAGPECAAVQFLSEKELVGRPVAWSGSIGSMRQRLFDEIRTGRFSIQLTGIGADNADSYRSHVYTIEREGK
jgi:ADP-ribose pyrophosphatase YjhB (NUDIX family)